MQKSPTGRRKRISITNKGIEFYMTDTVIINKADINKQLNDLKAVVKDLEEAIIEIKEEKSNESTLTKLNSAQSLANGVIIFIIKIWHDVINIYCEGLYMECVSCKKEFKQFEEGNSFICNECISEIVHDEKTVLKSNERNISEKLICTRCGKETSKHYTVGNWKNICLFCFEKYYHSTNFNFRDSKF